MKPFEIEIVSAADRHGLPKALVFAVVQVESSFRPFAWKPEPPYRYLWDVHQSRAFRPCTAGEIASEHAPTDFPCLAGHRDQEWWGQQASWGLMQIMGAVARERGCGVAYLPELTEVPTNLEYGCAHLHYLRNRLLINHGWDGVIAAYNTGGPAREPGSAGEDYVRKIRAYWHA